jgi:hypothetical protein
VAAPLPRETTLTIRQIAQRLCLGSWKSLNHQLYLRAFGRTKSAACPRPRAPSKLCRYLRFMDAWLPGLTQQPGQQRDGFLANGEHLTQVLLHLCQVGLFLLQRLAELGEFGFQFAR